MAEKGVIVDDAITGESVACRDAIQQDDDLNNRIIQLVDKAARPVVYQRTTAIRSSVSSSDTFDLDPLPAAIAGALIDVSDAESCVIWAVISSGTSTDSDSLTVITPIIVSEDATPVAVALLPPIQLRPVYPKKTGDTNNWEVLTIGTRTSISIAQAFPTLGAKKIGFHIMHSDSLMDLDLYAAATSASYRNTALDQEIIDDVWGAHFCRS